MATATIAILLIVCALMAKVIQTLYKKLRSERAWADHPATFPILLERMCQRATKEDEVEALRFECRKALKLLDERPHERTGAHQVESWG